MVLASEVAQNRWAFLLPSLAHRFYLFLLLPCLSPRLSLSPSTSSLSISLPSVPTASKPFSLQISLSSYPFSRPFFLPSLVLKSWQGEEELALRAML